MPDTESAVRAKEIIEETGTADFPCIRFKVSREGRYLYGDLYPRNPTFDRWKPGDVQQ
jgi:hypothetical protein